MRFSAALLAGTALAAAAPALAAQEQPATAPVAEDGAPDPSDEVSAEVAEADSEIQPGDQAIVVTARKREESLQDVPVAVTAVSGETIEKRGFTQLKDVAQLTPSLNVNSDSVGRVFIAVRGIGTTLVGTVQPGVGIFVDGIYQPNTAYLNNPLVDVQRVEVLRGPQGTLYGKNTLGGAINVITRQPSNELQVRGGGSYAGPDNAWDVFASVSGPIVEDKLQVRVAGFHRQQDGFVRNRLIGTDANPLNMDGLNATIRALPAEDVVLTINGYYDSVKGGNIPYSHIDGPTDYSRTVLLSATNYQSFDYKGVNAKLQFPISGIDTNVTFVAAYDQRNGNTPDLDVDFNAFDLIRQRGRDKLKTTASELRFDSVWTDQISTLFGLFYSHETLRGATTAVQHLAFLPPPLPSFPLTQVNSTSDRRKGDTYAAFGTLFWKPSDLWEAAFGLRVDHEKRSAEGAQGITILPGTVALPDADDVPLNLISPKIKLKSTEILPKVTVTRHWSRDLMTYGSISRGFRGGGFNAPTAPFRTYKGDSVWTFELGSKYSSPDRRLSLAGALFYNDYKDFIGLNNFVVGTNNQAVTVDLNTGDVRSYGAEIEVSYRPTSNWVLTGGGSLIHARIQNFDGLREATATPANPDGIALASKRLPFQPDWTANLNSDYTFALGSGDLTLSTGVVAKGSRVGASLSETRAPVLKAYALVNAAVTYAIGPVEFGAFVNNAFNKKYMESFIEKSTLFSVFGPLIDPTTGQPLASDLGITGDRRRYGVRARLRF